MVIAGTGSPEVVTVKEEKIPCGNATLEGLVNMGAVPAAARPAHAIERTAVRRAIALRLNRKGPTGDAAVRRGYK